MSWSAHAFLNTNLQVRKFRDFHQIESQNWFMAGASRQAWRGRLVLHAMLSLEPLTLRRLGSAQAFQTGETYDNAPLIDYQHPHDLFMGLEGRYERSFGRGSRFWVSIAPVGAATIGPTVFMHRASATANPTAPLTHHNLDSPHITRSVVAAGVSRGPWAIDASAFKAREPDENRWDLDGGVPDSWAGRVTWSPARFRIQVSGGRFTSPEAIEPFMDVVRLTASVEYEATLAGAPVSATVAFGRNRETYGNIDGSLAEAAWRPRQFIAYVRAEVVEKNILTAGGLHPPGFTHPHIFSTVGALTFGLARELRRSRAGDFAAGADLTMHVVPDNLRDSYGTRPYSVHVYLRWSVGNH